MPNFLKVSELSAQKNKRNLPNEREEKKKIKIKKQGKLFSSQHN